MNRDPLYRKIEKRLKGEDGYVLNGHVFERCAVDLLRRNEGFTVVLVGGTKDGGMDGAVSDGEGVPYPLVATTSPDTTRNLRRSLDSYLKREGKRRKAIFATSEILNGSQRDNLHCVAQEKGFKLVQIFDGTYFAAWLYRDPKWCKELLGVSGDPCPLSKVPLSTRPRLNSTVVGREEDLRWLIETKGDRLLVGQPGSGKTFLTTELVSRELGLFVVSRDREEIAEGVRAQEPTLLIVDDASPDDPILQNLCQLREATYAEFDILATCWPRHRQAVADILKLTENYVHTLELMTQEQIAQVIEDTGLQCSTSAMNELVRQSEGRPGLAATLANAALQGGWDDVVTGSALFKTLARHIDEEALPVLASVALSGDKGLTMKEVSRALSQRKIDVWRLMRDCRAAGIVKDVSTDRLSVRPPALRCALLAEVFFRGALSYPIEDVIAAIGSERADVDVLIEACARGAHVPDELIIPMLSSASSWRNYASLGKARAQFVLSNHPERIIDVGAPALRYCPDCALDLLLKASVGDTRAVHSHPRHPMRLIKDWITGAYPGTRDVVKRRRALLDAVDRWLSSGGDVETGLCACEWVMSIAYHRTDPLDVRHQVTLRFGFITPQDVTRLETFWPHIVGLYIYKSTGSTSWQPLYHIIHDWAFPYAGGGSSASEGLRCRTRAFAATMLRDLLELAEGELDVYHWATKVNEQAGLGVKVPSLDRDFEVLYPIDRLREDWQQARDEQVKRVKELAAEWATRDPAQVAQRLVYLEGVGNRLEVVRERWVPRVCALIAKGITHPLDWSVAFTEAKLPHELIVPFLRKAVELGVAGWGDQLTTCLEDSVSCPMVEFVLTLPDPPKSALERVLSVAETCLSQIYVCCLRGQVPEQTSRLLLRHSDAIVAQEAAKGEWHANPRGKIRQGLAEDWRKTVIKSELDYWLAEVFQNNADLAADWLQANMFDLPLFPVGSDKDVLQSLVGALTPDMRSKILDELPDGISCLLIVKLLVGNDLSLYASLLGNSQLSHYHLIPLVGLPDEKWVGKVRLALENYGPEEIAEATFSRLQPETFWGPESARWEPWISAFEPLCKSDDARIRKIATIGLKRARQEYESAIERERQEAIYGW